MHKQQRRYIALPTYLIGADVQRETETLIAQLQARLMELKAAHKDVTDKKLKAATNAARVSPKKLGIIPTSNKAARAEYEARRRVQTEVGSSVGDTELLLKLINSASSAPLLFDTSEGLKQHPDDVSLFVNIIEGGNKVSFSGRSGDLYETGDVRVLAMLLKNNIEVKVESK